MVRLASRGSRVSVISRTLLAAAAICAGPSAFAGSTPNILFIVYDDVGLDQMAGPPFNWTLDKPDAPHMPVLNAISAAGVSFTNFWAMPECSPSRSCFFTGRWPLRTGVVSAIIDPMLPQCQLNPAEITIPQVLAGAGYSTTMIGKYHMAGGTSPFGNAAPVTAGHLETYDGNLVLPPSIDQTVGGQLGSSDDPATCGSPTTGVGAACFQGKGGTECQEGWDPLEAMAAGGVPLLKVNGDGTWTLAKSCAEASCDDVTFENLNAYYSWMRTIVDANGQATQISPYRHYMTTELTDRTVDWVTNHGGTKGGPWMCILTYTASHTPIQTPPPSLLPDGTSVDFDCSSTLGQRQVFKLMTEAMDREQGRLLAELGLGSYDKEGTFTLTDPALTNTLIVVIGDNGSFGPTVRQPFNPDQAKGTVYQTGVLVPLVVAGPMVVSPNRTVDKMVNIVDLFQLFAETGGVDLATVIPPYRTLDSVTMMPYLVDPSAAEVRTFDFTQYAPGVSLPGEFLPCLIDSTCIDTTIRDASFCEDQGGTWYGDQGMTCCDLIQQGILPADTVLAPTVQYAVQQGRYKLLVLEYESCAAVPCEIQFHKLPVATPPAIAPIEKCGNQLCIATLGPAEKMIYETLLAKMIEIIQSEPVCVGDGNLDLKVDGNDIGGVLAYWDIGPSFYDFNEDGQTDAADLAIVLDNWTPRCNNRSAALPPCLSDPPTGNQPGAACQPCSR
ncbi:MAG: sulfatase-like hydrolase/transferase [Phycisphaerales bacterium]